DVRERAGVHLTDVDPFGGRAHAGAGPDEGGGHCQDGNETLHGANAFWRKKSRRSVIPRSSRRARNFGRIPVHLRVPAYRPSSSVPARKSYVKMSWRVTMSPSIATTSVICVTRREPSASLA